MRKFYLIVNPTRDNGLQAAKKVETYLRDAGCTFKTHISVNSVNDIYTAADSIPEDTECVLVIGGDGTMIQAARDLAELDIPLLGINMGHMGYLTDVEIDDIDPSLKSLIEDRYIVDDRMMITGDILEEIPDSIYDRAYDQSSGGDQAEACSVSYPSCISGKTADANSGEMNLDVIDKGLAERTAKRRDRALNDIVVHRSGYMRVIDYNVFVNGKFLKSYRADGIIVSTPTGSTAYSLSAGGPIVEPGSKLFIITPICPHTLNSRSIVLSSDDEIFISTSEKDTSVSYDGREKGLIPPNGGVRITRSNKVARIVRLHDNSFLNVLHNKFIDTV
ncbi:MAG: NAD(+)/NADH kinase [Lachnospiraceae bacterium]|nr:NAD(+)/NADH kinase [Lachnospiraceae bacterium]